MAFESLLAQQTPLQAFLARSDLNRQQGMQQDAATLQQATGLAGLLQQSQAMAKAQRDAQLQDQYRIAIGNATTPAEQAAAVVKFGSPKDVLSHLDRQATIASTKEAVLARLAQQGQQYDQNYQLRLKAATSADEKAAIDAQYRQAKLALENAALRMTGERLNYDTGANVAVPNVGITIPPTAAPTTTQDTTASGPVDFRFQTPSGVTSGTAPNDAQARKQASAATGVPVSQFTPPVGTQSLAVAPVQPIATQQPAAYDPNSFEARTGAPNPFGTAPTPTPSAVPAAPSAIPAMPPEIARLPRKQQDAWTLAQTKSGAGQLTPDGLDMAAVKYRQTGVIPSLGMGGMSARLAVMNRAAEMAKAEGSTAEAESLRGATFKASQVALSDLSKREAQVGAFEKTFNANTNLVAQLSAKSDRTGVPLLNKWINAGKRAITGDTDIVALDAAIKGASNEYAKIVSGSMGNVAMSEQEIKKVENLLNSAQTPEQVLSVMNTMKVETVNRMKGFQDQKQQIVSSMRINQSGQQSFPAAAQNQQLAPRDPTQRTPNTVYVTPKGPLKWTGSEWVNP